jgi:hypothetical protein
MAVEVGEVSADKRLPIQPSNQIQNNALSPGSGSRAFSNQNLQPDGTSYT